MKVFSIFLHNFFSICKKRIKTETLLENDYIYFKGSSAGNMTYTTVLGAEMTIPAFIVDEVTR